MIETKFFVVEAYRYKESGNWEYKMVGAYDTLSAAKQAYYSNMGSIIKDSNDFSDLFHCFLSFLFDSAQFCCCSTICIRFIGKGHR